MLASPGRVTRGQVLGISRLCPTFPERNTIMRSLTLRLTLAGLFTCAGPFLVAPRAEAQTQRPAAQAQRPPSQRGMVSSLELEIRTGSDELRGGNDNLNIEVLFRS